MFIATTSYFPLMYPIVLSLKCTLGCQNFYIFLLAGFYEGLLNSSCKAILNQEAPPNGYSLRVMEFLNFIFTTVFCQATQYLLCIEAQSGKLPCRILITFSLSCCILLSARQKTTHILPIAAWGLLSNIDFTFIEVTPLSPF